MDGTDELSWRDHHSPHIAHLFDFRTWVRQGQNDTSRKGRGAHTCSGPPPAGLQMRPHCVEDGTEFPSGFLLATGEGCS